MSKIVLIAPRLAVQKGDFLGSGVPYWPVELAYLASFLQRRNSEVAVVDLFGEKITNLEDKGDHYLQGCNIEDLIRKDERLERSALFLVYATSAMSHHEILSIITSLKAAYHDTPVCILENSQAVTSYSLPHMSADFFAKGVDFLICGAPYWNWNEIDAFVLNHSPAPENVMTASKSVDEIQRKFVKEVSLPPPAWEFFNLRNYWKIPYSHGPKTKCYLPIFTSRGCPYPCDFCVVPELNRLNWAGRDPQEVADEMIYLKAKFGVEDFQIEDLNPTITARRWVQISDILLEKNAGVRFGFVSGTKSETVKVSQVPKLSAAGLRFLSISPESGSARLMNIIGKVFDYDHGLELVAACHEHGIATQACLLVGHPQENEEDFRQSCEYLRKLVRAGLDEVAVFIVSPFYGSKLYASEAISMEDDKRLISFSPKGRASYPVLETRRKKLIRIFFIEKLKRGMPLWLQGVRALLGTPRTKMENLPKRIAYIYGLIFKQKLKQLLGK